MKKSCGLLLCVLLCLWGVRISLADEKEHKTKQKIEITFGEIIYTDTVEVEWNERYPVPEGGVKWDGTEEFIGFEHRDEWKTVKGEKYDYVDGQIAFMADLGSYFYEVE